MSWWDTALTVVAPEVQLARKGYKAASNVLSGNKTVLPKPDATAYGFADPNDPSQINANNIAAGDVAKYGAIGAGMNQYGTNALNGSMAAQGIAPPKISQDPLDRQRQLAALGATNATAGQLQQLGTAPMGPSVAAAQLQQGQDAAMQQSLAMARSGRSLGGGAAAMQQAQFQNAQTQSATNQSAVAARLQEQQQYRQMQLAALGGAQQGYGQVAGQANAINQNDMGLQGQNAALRLQQQGANNQTTAALGQIGTAMTGQGEAATQFGEQLGFNVQGQQLQANEAYQNALLGQATAQNQITQANLNSQQAMISSGLGAAATASDRDAKQNIMPAGGVPDQWGNTFGGAQNEDPRFSTAAPPAPAPTMYGLTPQQQQMQMGQMYGADARADALAKMDPMVRARQMYDTSSELARIRDAGARQQAAAGLQASDVHSKAKIADLSEQNRSLIAALQGSGPTREMLNQAASDQDAGARIQYRPSPAAPSRAMLNDAAADQAAPGGHIQYPAPGAPPSAQMLAQAAADQDNAPVPAPDRPAIDLRPAMPYSYEYKDPMRHGQGRFFGPMAQDLEKTPAGASVVKRAPDGTKMVDTSRLSLVNTGAISDLQRQIAALGGKQLRPGMFGDSNPDSGLAPELFRPDSNFKRAVARANAAGFDGVRKQGNGWVAATDVPLGGDQDAR